LKKCIVSLFYILHVIMNYDDLEERISKLESKVRLRDTVSYIVM